MARLAVLWVSFCFYGDSWSYHSTECELVYIAAEKKRFFFYKLWHCSWIKLTFVGTAWQGDSHRINSLQSRHRPRVASTGWLLGWDNGMLLELFYMLEICCGSGASSRAMIMHMRRVGRAGRSLLIDYMPLEQLLATLRPRHSRD